MTVLPIYLAVHPVLTTVADKVDAVDDDIRKLMDDMLDTMYAYRGIGLAAPQVGVGKRVIVMDVEQIAPPEDEDEGEDDDTDQDTPAALPQRGNPVCMANPEIVWTSEETNIYNEGCLSLPMLYADVERPANVRVKYLDYDGKEQEIAADGLLATCVQHEIDHINGILFADHLSKLKRDMIIRKLKKWIKENADDIGTRYIF